MKSLMKRIVKNSLIGAVLGSVISALVIGCLDNTGPRHYDLSGVWHYHVAYLGQNVGFNVFSAAQTGDSIYWDLGSGVVFGDSVLLNDDPDGLHWHGIILDNGNELRGHMTTYDNPPIEFVGLDWFAVRQ